MLQGNDTGLRAVVVRLPPFVYARGFSFLYNVMYKAAEKNGSASFVGAGEQCRSGEGSLSFEVRRVLNHPAWCRTAEYHAGTALSCLQASSCNVSVAWRSSQDEVVGHSFTFASHCACTTKATPGHVQPPKGWMLLDHLEPVSNGIIDNINCSPLTPLLPSAGDNKMCAVHVDDAARAYVALLTHSSAKGIYNVVGENGVTSKDLAERIASKLHCGTESITREEAQKLFGFVIAMRTGANNPPELTAVVAAVPAMSCNHFTYVQVRPL